MELFSNVTCWFFGFLDEPFFIVLSNNWWWKLSTILIKVERGAFISLLSANVKKKVQNQWCCKGLLLLSFEKIYGKDLSVQGQIFALKTFWTRAKGLKTPLKTLSPNLTVNHLKSAKKKWSVVFDFSGSVFVKTTITIQMVHSIYKLTYLWRHIFPPLFV